MRTTYRGERVDMALLEQDAEADAYCVNDDCPGLEVDFDVDEDTGEKIPNEVRRIAWDCGWHRPTGPSYSCGGEPGYADRPECPVCGGDSESL